MTRNRARINSTGKTNGPRGRRNVSTGRVLTQDLSDDHASVFSPDGGAGVPLVRELDESVAFVDRAAHDHAVLAEDGLHVGFGHQHGVQVPDEDARVQRTRVRLVGHVAGHRVRRVAGEGEGEKKTKKLSSIKTEIESISISYNSER